MALQLDTYTDEFGTTHSAAYVRIVGISTAIPPDGNTVTIYEVHKDQAARQGGFSPILKAKISLTFNPFVNTAQADAYTELSQSGGIFVNSIDV